MKKPENINELDLMKSVDQAMNNSYNVIIGNISIEELMVDSDFHSHVFMHNIETGHTQQDLKVLKEHFEKVEDYEKCIELTNMIIGD